jgi:ketosteroid isomerase-like protein
VLRVGSRWFWPEAEAWRDTALVASANVELVRRFFERLSGDPQVDSNWNDALSVLASDFEYREDPVWPGASTYRGIDAFRRAVIDYREMLGEMSVEAEDFIDAGDCVVALYTWRARTDRGIEAEARQAGIFEVRAGRITTWQIYFDREQALKDAGVRR